MVNAVLGFLKSHWSPSEPHATPENDWHFEYNAVPGFFVQDHKWTNPGTTDAVTKNFGLIDQVYDTDRLLPANGKHLTQWQRFAHKIQVMNQRARPDVSYRLLYLGRHGNGYHNVAAKYYGDEAWNCYYSRLNTDPHVPGIPYLDAPLTPLGEHQARTASAAWHHQLTAHHTPAPQTFYTSPQTRALQTAQLTFSPLPLAPSHPFRPTVKELLREAHSAHVCDLRPRASHIVSTFPGFRLEHAFAESDPLWRADRRETPRAHVARSRRVLDDIFAADDSVYVSVTAHSGTVLALLAVLGHRGCLLPTGGVLPVLVRVSRNKGARDGVGVGNEEVGVGVEKEEGGEWEWDEVPDQWEVDEKGPGRNGYRDIGVYLDEIEKGIARGGGGGDRIA